MRYLVNRKPWNSFADFSHPSERLMGELLSGGFGFDPSKSERSWYPACDILERDEAYLIALDLPGMAKEDLKIEIEGDLLRISGEHKEERSENVRSTRYSERKFGKFQRSFSVPEGLTSEKIEASYRDGVLRIVVPKVEASKPKQVKIGEDKTSFDRHLTGEPKKVSHDTKSVA